MYSVEPYGNGFILCDYSGNRGQFGAAYRGRDGEWRDQPIGIPPFDTEADATASAMESAE